MTIDGELIETTAEHPFYTDEGEWVNAADLSVGELIWSFDGDYGVVETVILVEDVYQPMYNLTVIEAHTFYIGDGDWLVHNEDDIITLPGLPGERGIIVPRQITVAEMVSYTNDWYGYEFKLQQEFNPNTRQWNWWLYSGDEDSVRSDFGWWVRDWYHTHPSGKPIPSTADRNRLRNLMQEQARVWGSPLQTQAGLIPTIGPARNNLINYDVETTKAQWQETSLYNQWVEWYNRRNGC